MCVCVFSLVVPLLSSFSQAGLLALPVLAKIALDGTGSLSSAPWYLWVAQALLPFAAAASLQLCYRYAKRVNLRFRPHLLYLLIAKSAVDTVKGRGLVWMGYKFILVKVVRGCYYVRQCIPLLGRLIGELALLAFTLLWSLWPILPPIVTKQYLWLLLTVPASALLLYRARTIIKNNWRREPIDEDAEREAEEAKRAEEKKRQADRKQQQPERKRPSSPSPVAVGRSAAGRGQHQQQQPARSQPSVASSRSQYPVDDLEWRKREMARRLQEEKERNKGAEGRSVPEEGEPGAGVQRVGSDSVEVISPYQEEGLAAGAAAASKVWACPRCTFENGISRNFCEMCNERAPPRRVGWQ